MRRLNCILAVDLAHHPGQGSGRHLGVNAFLPFSRQVKELLLRLILLGWILEGSHVVLLLRERIEHRLPSAVLLLFILLRVSGLGLGLIRHGRLVVPQGFLGLLGEVQPVNDRCRHLLLLF